MRSGVIEMVSEYIPQVTRKLVQARARGYCEHWSKSINDRIAFWGCLAELGGLTTIFWLPESQTGSTIPSQIR
jgi:hypothetical protein